MGAISTKFHRELLAGAKEVVTAAGGTCRLDVGRGGHGKLVIEVGSKQRTTPVACSPSCVDQALKHKMADVRRILREMGGC